MIAFHCKPSQQGSEVQLLQRAPSPEKRRVVGDHQPRTAKIDVGFKVGKPIVKSIQQRALVPIVVVRISVGKRGHLCICGEAEELHAGYQQTGCFEDISRWKYQQYKIATLE
jgi:hypothetical protein